MNKPLIRRIVSLLIGMTPIAAVAVMVSDGERQIPEYLGSQACLACHVEQYGKWKPSDHAGMLVPIVNASDLPLDINKASAGLKAELRKASYMVAGYLFIARDPATQHYRLLPVAYDKAGKRYTSSPVTLNWSTSCAGCHTTNLNTAKLTWGEPGIGCEACHGPGRDHVLSKGDKSKIVSTRDADACGQCHGGADGLTGGKLMSDGTKWIVGYRPGMKLSAVPGVQLTPVDATKTPPDSDVSSTHLRNYNMWAASGHAKALSRISESSFANADCFGCHSAEGLAAKLRGDKVDMTKKAGFSSLTCVACHKPHDSDNPHQLVTSAERLCNECHGQEAFVKGTAAKGIETTVASHSNLSCIQCHMTESNHLMKVIRPDAPDLAAKRADTCTSCHKGSSKKDRGARLQEWQRSYAKRMDPFQADLKIISAAAKAKPELLSAELKARLAAAQANLSILTRDRSRGAHNFEYAMKIMDQIAKDLAEVKGAVK